MRSRFSRSRSSRASDESIAVTAKPAAASCIVLPPGAAQRSSAVRPSPGPSNRAGIDAEMSCTHQSPSPKPASSATEAPRSSRKWPGIRLTPAKLGRRAGRREGDVERRRHRHRLAGGLDDVAAPGLLPARDHRAGQSGNFGQLDALPHQGAEHAVDELARAAVDQRQNGRDRGVLRRAHRQRLDQRDAQGEARLGVVGQGLLGRAVDQGVEIGEPAQRLGRDRVREGAVVGPVEVARGGVERGFERKPLAQARRRAGAKRRGATRCRSDRARSADRPWPAGIETIHLA